MAQQGIINGTDITLMIDGSTLMLCTSTSFNVDHKLRDTTVFESENWKQQIPGERSWSVEAEGYLAFRKSDGSSLGNGSIDTILYLAYLWQQKLSLYIPTTPSFPAVSNDVFWFGYVYLTGFESSAGMEDSTTYSLSLQGTGEFIQSTL